MARACWWDRRKTIEGCIIRNQTVIWHCIQNMICSTESKHTFDIFALAEIFSLRAPHHSVLEGYFQPSSCRHCTSWKINALKTKNANTLTRDYSLVSPNKMLRWWWRHRGCWKDTEASLAATSGFLFPLCDHLGFPNMKKVGRNTEN